MLRDLEGSEMSGSEADHHRSAKGNRSGETIGTLRGDRKGEGRVCIRDKIPLSNVDIRHPSGDCVLEHSSESTMADGGSMEDYGYQGGSDGGRHRLPLGGLRRPVLDRATSRPISYGSTTRTALGEDYHQPRLRRSRALIRALHGSGCGNGSTSLRRSRAALSGSGSGSGSGSESGYDSAPTILVSRKVRGWDGGREFCGRRKL